MQRVKFITVLVIALLLAMSPLSTAGATGSPSPANGPGDPEQAPNADNGSAVSAQPASAVAPDSPPGCGLPGDWSAIAPLNVARSRLGAVYSAATSKFYVLGGESTGGNRAIPIEEYDPVANTWTARTNLLTGVSNTGAAAVGSYIYVPGGYDGTAAVTRTQRYDAVANTVVWMAGTLPAGNYAHAVTALGTKIYVFGGSSTGAAGTTNYIYDTVADTWSTGLALPTAVQYPTATTDGTYLYVLGGYLDLNTVQVYDPVANTWSAGPTMLTARGGPASFFDGTRMFVVGGGWSTYLAATEYFEGGAWHAGPPLVAGSRTTGAAYGGGIAIKGGGWNGGYMTQAEKLTYAPPCQAGADVGITVTDTPDPVYKGAILTYDLTVTNYGLDPATGVIVTSTLPTGYIPLGATPSAGTCTTGGGTVVCSLGTVAVGTPATVQITGAADVSVACESTFTNRANVTTTANDYYPDNNAVSVSTAVTCASCTTYMSTNVPLAISDLTLVTSTLTVAPSQTIIDINVVGLWITHTYDSDLRVQLYSPASTMDLLFNGVGGSGDNFISTVLDDEATTPIAGGTAPFTGSYRPASPLSVYDGADAQGTWSLEIYDQFGGDTGTLNAWGLEVCESVNPTYEADTSVAVNASAASVTPGDPLDYTFAVANAGPNVATDVVMSATLPTAWVFGTGSISQGSCTYSGTSHLLDCDFGTLGPGGTATVALYGTIDAAAACPATLAFDATVASAVADPNTANNTASSSVNLTCAGAPDPLTCNAPAIGFNLGIPTDWTVVNNETGTVVWGNLTACGEAGNFTGGTGDPACASSDVAGAMEFDTELRSNAFNLTGFTSASLTYLANYQNFANYDYLDLDISTDSGTTWTPLLSWNEDHGTFRGLPGVSVNVDLSAYAGMSNLTLRWHYYDPNASDYDWYAQVDDIALGCSTGGAPAIVVDPAALALTVPQGYPAAIVQTLTISNTGTAVLDWTIDEQAAFQPVAKSGGPAGNPGITLSAATGAALPAAPPAHPEAVLWDQPLSTVNTNAYISQAFPDVPTYSSYLADDFVNAAPWSITNIFVPGGLWNGATSIANATGFSWLIYADNAGVPAGDPSGAGAAPVWSLTLLPTDSQVVITNGSGALPSDVLLNLTTPASLPAGHYWLIFYPTMEFGTFGQYGRQPADTTNGYTSQFVNPGGGFGYGTAWQSWAVLGATQTDMAFRIEGTAGPAGCTPSDIPWLAASPTSGSTAAGAATPVDVTYSNISALAVGTYTGNLCVASNDPVNPTVLVPVTLTVRPPTAVDTTALAARTVAPLGLLVPVAGALLALVAFVLLRKRR